MFHWICPECGREIPPAVKECPACDPQPEQAATPSAPLFEAVAETAPVPPPAARIAVPATAAVLSSPPALPAAETSLEAPRPAPQETPPETIDPLLAMAERVRAVQVAAEKPAPKTQEVAPQEVAPQLVELAAAVGLSEAPTLELIPIPAFAVPELIAVGAAEYPQPVALLLAPPELETAPTSVGLAEPVADPVTGPASNGSPRTPWRPSPPLALADPLADRLPPPLAPEETREEAPAAPVALSERVIAPPSMAPEEAQEETPAPAALAEPVIAPPPTTPEETHQATPAAPVALAESVIAPPSIAPEETREEAPAPVALAEPVIAPPPTTPEETREEALAAPVALAEPVIAPPPMALEESREEAPAAPVALSEPVSAAPPVVPEEVPPAPLAESVPHILPAPSASQLQTPPELRTEPLGQSTAAPVPETPADRPPSGSWLKLAPLQNYSAAATHAMRPAAPTARILTPDSGPRMTLPGPALPPQLNVRENLHVVTVLGDRPPKGRGIPGWLVSFLVMGALLLAGAAVVFYLLPASHTTADAKTAAPEPAAAPVVESSHPLAQYVEVTGIRFVMDLNKKSEIQYLVVNHSGAELSDMTVFVTVRAANAKAGQPPLCRFSFRSTGLGPFESKEMTSPIEKMARPVALPDWHDLRAEVQIAQ